MEYGYCPSDEEMLREERIAKKQARHEADKANGVYSKCRQCGSHGCIVPHHVGGKIGLCSCCGTEGRVYESMRVYKS